jgi:hypothetical protein
MFYNFASLIVVWFCHGWNAILVGFEWFISGGYCGALPIRAAVPCPNRNKRDDGESNPQPSGSSDK